MMELHLSCLKADQVLAAYMPSLLQPQPCRICRQLAPWVATSLCARTSARTRSTCTSPSPFSWALVLASSSSSLCASPPPPFPLRISHSFPCPLCATGLLSSTAPHRTPKPCVLAHADSPAHPVPSPAHAVATLPPLRPPPPQILVGVNSLMGTQTMQTWPDPQVDKNLIVHEN